MTHSGFDSFRPPEPARRRRTGGKRRRAAATTVTARGKCPWFPSRNSPLTTAVPWSSRAPWGDDVALYLFLGGVAGGSALLGLGGQLTGRPMLRRNARLSALTAVSLGAVALVKDLGRPERFLNMLRTFKVTSPMSVGSWILSAFSAGTAVSAVAEIDRLSGTRLPLGPLRKVLQAVEGPAGFEAALFAGPLAAYTAVLLGDTATPTWNAAHEELPFVFVSSAALASSGLAMITTPVHEAGPARKLAAFGVLGDLVAMRVMEYRMDPVAAEPLHQGKAGGHAEMERAAGGQPAGWGRCWPGATARSPRLRGWRCWLPRPSPGSACSKRASPRPGIRATRSNRRRTGSLPAARRASPTIRLPLPADAPAVV